jgi:hypothetical protein
MRCNPASGLTTGVPCAIIDWTGRASQYDIGTSSAIGPQIRYHRRAVARHALPLTPERLATLIE